MELAFQVQHRTLLRFLLSSALLEPTVQGEQKLRQLFLTNFDGNLFCSEFHHVASDNCLLFKEQAKRNRINFLSTFFEDLLNNLIINLIHLSGISSFVISMKLTVAAERQSL